MCVITVLRTLTQQLNKSVVLIVSIALLSGCAATTIHKKKPMANDPDYAPVSAKSLNEIPNINGGLYQTSYNLSLFSDQRARRIGDIITVILSENTQSKKSAATNLKKDSSADFSPTNVLGSVPVFNRLTMGMDLDSSRSFNGAGDSDRSNSLMGTITVTVSNILPNGVLEVRGEKWLTLNQGDEYIRIKGLIRPGDISPQNTIYSGKLADARISFGGIGDIADANEQGWFTRFLSSSWWPF